MTNTDHPPALRVYSMDDQALTAEQIAVTFAMTSRNPDPFDVIARRVSEQKAADFNDRWVIGYGHASVAEHAVLHLALENISRLAADQVLNNRLASYTEKSSRYQLIPTGYYHTPQELAPYPELNRIYQQACQRLFAAYYRITESIVKHLIAQHGTHQPSDTDRMRYQRQATDASRSLLPAATLTNLGMTANARSMEHCISKLLSSPLEEARNVGANLHAASLPIVPTLLKYADRTDWLAKHQSRHHSAAHPTGSRPPPARIIKQPADPYQELAIAFLARQHADYQSAQISAITAGPQGQRDLIGSYMADRGRHDPIPREFELVRYRIQFRFDYGALREFRRHRMQTLLGNPLTVANGYDTDPLIADAGLTGQYTAALEQAQNAYHRIAAMLPTAAEYLVTHAHYQTVVADINLRECYHLFGLRSTRQAHRGIREPVQHAMAEIERLHPGILGWMTPDTV